MLDGVGWPTSSTAHVCGDDAQLPSNPVGRHACVCVWFALQVEQLEEVERAFVHVDYEKRDGLEHKVRCWLYVGGSVDASPGEEVLAIDNMQEIDNNETSLPSCCCCCCCLLILHTPHRRWSGSWRSHVLCRQAAAAGASPPGSTMQEVCWHHGIN